MTFPKASTKLEKPTFLRGLRWKMVLSFVLLFFCLIGVLGIIGSALEYVYLRKSFEQAGVNNNEYLFKGFFEIENGLTTDYNHLQKDSSELLPWLNLQTRNPDAIRLWLKRYDEKLKLRRKTLFSSTYLFPNDFDLEEETRIPVAFDYTAASLMKKKIFHFIVFDEKSEIIASTDSADNYAEEKLFVEDMLKENVGIKRRFEDRDGLHLRLAFPIFDDQNQIKGVLFFKETLPADWSEAFQNGVYSIGEQFVPNLIFIAILGFIFGSPFAWYLSKRMQKIAFAAQSWRTGDFSARTNDKSKDEVGILSRNLNEMADDLRENFALRQTIATVEERNRIARDLHDSVKQQVFGLAMQISTASALVEKNPESAKNYLQESENLIKEIQAELVDMIHEFSLPVNESQTFKAKIENLVSDWSRQNVMKTEIAIDDNLPISADSSQTFYRIAQETLSNIARHSEATEVKISLKTIDKKLQMSFIDNGCGFDAENVKKGFGLQSIRERAESLPNGRLKIESKINAGTTIEVGCEIV